MKTIMMALFSASLLLPGCFLFPTCDSEGAAEWVQPDIYEEALAKNPQTNPYEDTIFLNDSNINNMDVIALIYPDDRVYSAAKINGPPQRFHLDQLEGAVRELFQRNNLTFDPPKFEPYHEQMGCGL